MSTSRGCDQPGQSRLKDMGTIYILMQVHILTGAAHGSYTFRALGHAWLNLCSTLCIRSDCLHKTFTNYRKGSKKLWKKQHTARLKDWSTILGNWQTARLGDRDTEQLLELVVRADSIKMLASLIGTKRVPYTYSTGWPTVGQSREMPERKIQNLLWFENAVLRIVIYSVSLLSGKLWAPLSVHCFP